MPGHLQRYREIAQVLSRNGLYATAYQAGLGRWLPSLGHGYVNPREDDDIRPEILVQTFRDLGTTYVKFGQALSMRRDLLPDPYCDALSTLTDSEPPIPVSDIRAVVRADLGADVTELFASFDEVAIATASIGQVHAAVLHDGREVVVKVRKPGVVDKVTEDLEILGNIARHLERNSGFFSDIGVTGLVEEFSRALRAEMDYTIEAHACEEFGAYFAGDKRIHIPWIHWDTSSTRVLTMERLTGIRVDNIAALDAQGIDRHSLALRSCEMLLRMVFEMGKFHADPHSGNLLIEPDGTIGVIDFGMVGRMTATMTRQFAAIIVGMYRNDPNVVAEALVALAPPRGRLDRSALRREVSGLLAAMEGRRLTDVKMVDVGMYLFRIVRTQRLALPADIVLLVRMLTIVDGLGRRLDPTFALSDALNPFAERLLLQRLDPRYWAGRAREATLDAVMLSTELPSYARRLVERLDKDGVDINLRADELEPLVARAEGMTDRLVLGMVVAAMIAGGSNILVANTDRLGRFAGPVLGAMWGVLGATGGYLAWTGRPWGRGRTPKR
ncbi:ABC1 kinase family protein [Raineyella sp. LH-20]|uniref:ABC1 kinase family protein n=1 Tax=Raineyella sp. LH-20 TaxID=3081204 RepID=UPI002955BD1E|nr:AarF/UbiB family protein [Raineyella sp. LH-20]WOP19192.1 AarF/UbiB family protein [Raineyella sp. LH-20]